MQQFYTSICIAWKNQENIDVHLAKQVKIEKNFNDWVQFFILYSLDIAPLVFDSESKLKDDYEIEKTSLQNTIETTTLLLQQKEKEVDKLQNEVTNYQPFTVYQAKQNEEIFGMMTKPHGKLNK